MRRYTPRKCHGAKRKNALCHNGQSADWHSNKLNTGYAPKLLGTSARRLGDARQNTSFLAYAEFSDYSYDCLGEITHYLSRPTTRSAVCHLVPEQYRIGWPRRSVFPMLGDTTGIRCADGVRPWGAIKGASYCTSNPLCPARSTALGPLHPCSLCAFIRASQLRQPMPRKQKTKKAARRRPCQRCRRVTGDIYWSGRGDSNARP